MPSVPNARATTPEAQSRPESRYAGVAFNQASPLNPDQ
jgi:hypothetical protein